ncbi:signal peptide containing protein [Cryptosporidium canis]|uniref:Signal peptide containing protein n=1 Tax=Cryptosporidium canis TaxID=195482 RepID=A0ABQ8PC35_9CRYT|nr:signal peptide containing protein [Cryptosporidium canis]KAJ1615550.1 signal peptide containing protein [Cryptosporidium canis]
MSQVRTFGKAWILLLAVCFNGILSQKVETTIESDVSLNSDISRSGGVLPVEPIGGSDGAMNSSSITESSNEGLGSRLNNPEIIPVNTNFTQSSCFNGTLPITCSNSNSTLLVPITSRFTTTIVGDSDNSGIVFEFRSESDEELISFRLNANDKNAIVRLSSLVNGTRVNEGLTSLELRGNQDDFSVNTEGAGSDSAVGRMTFVMVLTNTTVSFAVNNLVYDVLNINLAERPIRISRIQTSGLENVRISVIPFIENDEMDRCILSVPITGSDASSSSMAPYSKTCLSSNVMIPEGVLVPGSQLVLGIPGAVSSKSSKIAATTHIILSLRSGQILSHLMISDKGLFMRGAFGTDIVQSKGGYFPFQSYGYQSYSIKLVVTSLFLTIAVNGFYAFDPIVIPSNEVLYGVTFMGLSRNPTTTLLPMRSCTKYSYSGGGACSIDGVLPVLKSSGRSESTENHGKTLVAVRMVSDDTPSKRTSVSFSNGADVSEFLVSLDGSDAVLITNLTNLDKVDYRNNPQNDTFMIMDENIGGLRRGYFNGLQNTQNTRVSRAAGDYSVNVSGDGIAKISSEFIPVRRSCVLEQHRGSYVSTICEGSKLCFATGTTGSSVGGSLHFIGGFSNGVLKVQIYTKKNDFSFKVEYTSNGNISVYRTTAIKEDEPIYKGNYLDSSTSSSGRAVISIKDLGQMMLLSIDKMEVTTISKGGYGPEGNISCVQFFANEADDVSIFFEIQ